MSGHRQDLQIYAAQQIGNNLRNLVTIASFVSCALGIRRAHSHLLERLQELVCCPQGGDDAPHLTRLGFKLAFERCFNAFQVNLV